MGKGGNTSNERSTRILHLLCHFRRSIRMHGGRIDDNLILQRSTLHNILDCIFQYLVIANLKVLFAHSLPVRWTSALTEMNMISHILARPAMDMQGTPPSSNNGFPRDMVLFA